MSQPEDAPMKVTMRGCRRCSECVGCDHHWIENTEFGTPEPEAPYVSGADRPDATGNEFVCKHCEAVGNECEACDGTGQNQDDPEYNCPTCGGAGVILAQPKRFEEAWAK